MNGNTLRGLLISCGLVLLCPVAHGATSTRFLSVNASGVEGNQNSELPAISADGRYVAFVSRASNLVPLDSNAVEDIFYRDLLAGTITRVSVASDGTEADRRSTNPSISGDGRYVVFESDAWNLVPGKRAGIYLRDTQTAQTTFVAVGTNPVISSDGSTIAFATPSALLAADTNLVVDVYAVERETGSISLVSVSSGGVLGDKASGVGGVALSADGSIVAFQSMATTLAPGSNNPGGDVFVRDRNTNTTERVSVTYDGFQADKGSSAPSISADGNLVAFESVATDLIARDTNDSYDVFLRDRSANTTTRVSLNADGGEVAKDSRHAVLSADGRYVAFESESPDVVAGDLNNVMDIFIHDRDRGTTVRVSLTNVGTEVDGGSYDTALSRDARYVAFTSEGTNLTPGITGNVNNVFARGPLVEASGLLALRVEPAGASAGAAFTTQPVVEARGPDGMVMWDYDGPVALAIKPGTGRPGAILSGTTTVNATAGVATFSGLSLDLAGEGYVLIASSAPLDAAETAPFEVLQTPTKVVVAQEPSGAAAGVAFTVQPQIAVHDAEDNLVPWYTGTATIAIKPGTGRAGATLGGALSVPIINGTAEFSGLSLNLAGSGYVLVISAEGLASACLLYTSRCV